MRGLPLPRLAARPSPWFSEPAAYELSAQVSAEGQVGLDCARVEPLRLAVLSVAPCLLLPVDGDLLLEEDESRAVECGEDFERLWDLLLDAIGCSGC